MEKKEKYNVAVIGVGAVGVRLLQVLRERAFPVASLRVFARSARDISVDNLVYHVEAIEGSDFSGIDIALFAGTEGEKGASTTYAQKFIDAGAVVIDNGADFRLSPNVPLVVPEANRGKIKEHKGLIANPNCTTIQAIAALAGIYRQFGIKQMILTSFQATSGAGKKAAQTLWDETQAIVSKNKETDCELIDKRIEETGGTFSHQIAFNVIPQIGSFDDQGYTTEEMKVVHETHKIFDDDSILISATCARVPVFTSHSEAIYFITRQDATLEEVSRVLKDSEGVQFFDGQSFPLPLDAEGTDKTFVGRLRRDPGTKNAFWIWCVADNLRKGAALNAVQIAECLIGG